MFVWRLKFIYHFLGYIYKNIMLYSYVINSINKHSILEKNITNIYTNFKKLIIFFYNTHCITCGGGGGGLVKVFQSKVVLS